MAEVKKPKKNKRGGKKGNKGGGRKPAKTERLDLKFLEDLFLGKMKKSEIEELIKSGTYSIKDVYVAKAIAGNEKIINQIVNKIFANKTEISGPGGKPIGVKFELDEKSKNKINQLIGKFGGRLS